MCMITLHSYGPVAQGRDADQIGGREGRGDSTWIGRPIALAESQASAFLTVSLKMSSHIITQQEAVSSCQTSSSAVRFVLRFKMTAPSRLAAK